VILEDDMDYKWIVRENVSCWYELSWVEKPPAILIRLHKDFVEANPAISKDAPLVKQRIQEFNLSDFCGDLKRDFGFKDAPMKNMGLKNDFYEYLVKIPKIKKRTDAPCVSCRGEKKDFFGDKCHLCGGTGKSYNMDWKATNATSATLNIFFSFAEYVKTETSSPLPQLMTINTCMGKEMHGGSLGGEFSIPLVKWLRNNSDNFNSQVSVPAIEDAARIAFERMFGKSEYLVSTFRALILSTGLVISCPGNACEIDPGSYGPQETDRGYRFGCHNVDTFAQQLSLISGLACLHDLVRKETKSE
jgi:hypothetical protein